VEHARKKLGEHRSAITDAEEGKEWKEEEEEEALLECRSHLEKLRKGCSHPQLLDKSLRPAMLSSGQGMVSFPPTH
jgi:hypothetical protein